MPDSINEFIQGVVDGSISDDAIVSWLRNVCEYGLSKHETTLLTKGMMTSGKTINWGPQATSLVDKHSTGGVGDKVSIPLAPALVACGMPFASPKKTKNSGTPISTDPNKSARQARLFGRRV